MGLFKFFEEGAKNTDKITNGNSMYRLNMKRVSILTVLFVFTTFFAMTQEIPDHIKDMAKTALEYSKNEQYEKSISIFNKIITYSERENNSGLTKILKKQKINCYWGIAENKVNNDIKYGLFEACTHGLRLCKEIDEQYSLNSMMFSAWLAGYYYMNDDYKECNYAIDYTKRVIKECRYRKTETEDLIVEVEGMVAQLEKEVDRLINPPPTYSLSLGALYNVLTSNTSVSTFTSSSKKKDKLIKNEKNNTQIQIIEDGTYKYGSYTVSFPFLGQ